MFIHSYIYYYIYIYRITTSKNTCVTINMILSARTARTEGHFCRICVPTGTSFYCMAITTVPPCWVQSLCNEIQPGNQPNLRCMDSEHLI